MKRLGEFIVLGIAAGAAVFFLVHQAVRTGKPREPNEPPATVQEVTDGEPIRRLAVEAVGDEFRWSFTLPGPDDQLGTPDDVAVGNQLHLPVNCHVEFVLKSNDYVYIFSVPALNLREIAVPELTFRLSLPTAAAGNHEVIADPLCSVRLLHDEPMGELIVESQEAFRKWLFERQSKRA